MRRWWSIRRHPSRSRSSAGRIPRLRGTFQTLQKCFRCWEGERQQRSLGGFPRQCQDQILDGESAICSPRQAKDQFPTVAISEGIAMGGLAFSISSPASGATGGAILHGMAGVVGDCILGRHGGRCLGIQ